MNEEIYKRMALTIKYLYPESQCHVEVCVASYMDDSISRVNEATSTLTKATEALLQAAVREKKKVARKGGLLHLPSNPRSYPSKTTK